MKNKTSLLTALTFFLVTITNAQPSSNSFNRETMSYQGSKGEQAKLLLRKIKLWGNIGVMENIDPAFVHLIENDIAFTRDQFKQYLIRKSIPEIEIGGKIDDPVSFIMKNNQKIFAKYFVIHDVSSPVFENNFPDNINLDSWAFNNPNQWNAKKNHIYLTRTGKSKTVVDYAVGWRATKFELKILGESSKGLFIHIELVQPRIYPPGNETNAPVAPVPGFTDSQYDRLALLYLAASVRKGEWLVPAFHATIDEKLNDGHDDPQNFDLEKFVKAIFKSIENLKN